MKTNLITTLFLLFFITTSYAQNGTIKGTILTQRGNPAKNVVVKLNGNQEMEVDSLGKYQFSNLTPKSYEVRAKHIGFTSQVSSIVLKENETRILDFVLEEGTNTLQEVIVSAKKPIVEHELSSSLRVQTPILELSQNVQTINAEVLAKQQAFNLADGPFRNISGVSRQTHWNDMYVNINMRGSQIQAFRNGMNIVSSYWSPLSEDMATVEKIEFVKGPAGFMMSSGDPAGIYNVVTKKPTGQQNAEVTFSLGSFENYRSTLDLDGKLSKDGKLLYRLNIAGSSKASFRPNEDNKRLVIAPVLSYKINDKTTATLEYTYQKAVMTDVGSGYLMSPFGYKTLSRETTFSQKGTEPLDIDEHSAFINIEHKLNANWKLTAQGAYFNYNQIGASSWPKDILPDGKIIRKSDTWDAQSKMLLGQAFLNGSFNTGEVKHQILAGIDLGSKSYLADWNQSIILDSLNGGEFDPKNPVYGFDFGLQSFDRSHSLVQRAAIGGGIMSSDYNSAYVQDQMSFFDNALRLTLAARYTSMSISTWGGAPVKSDKVTPRIGLSYSIDKNTAVYALLDQSFLPQQGILFDGSKIKPITGNNYELGIKRDWFKGKWNSTIAIYQITKNHEITSYGPRPEMSVEVGQKRIRGLEVDIRGEILRGLNLIANYAYTDGQVTKTNEGVEAFFVGQRLDGADVHIANLWLDYELTRGKAKGLAFQFGGMSNIQRGLEFYSKDEPEKNIEDYFRFDAGMGYRIDKFSVNLNIQNLLDKYLIEGGSYYTTYFSTPVYSWQAGAPRNYRLTFAYKF